MTLERRAEQALRLRRVRSKLGGTPELRRGLFDIASIERGPPVRDVEQRVLGAIAGGDELASFLELRRAFLLAARPHEREPQLVVRLAALRLELHGVLQRRDRFRRLPVLQQAPCRARDAPAGSREPSRSPSRGARFPSWARESDLPRTPPQG